METVLVILIVVGFFAYRFAIGLAAVGLLPRSWRNWLIGEGQRHWLLSEGRRRNNA